MEFNLNGVKINKASLKDSKDILNLLGSSHNLVGYKDETFSLNEVKDYIKQKVNFVIVSKFKDKIIGVMIANFWKEYCYLYLFVVSQEYQGLGVGSLMLKYLEEKSRKQGYIGLIVKEDNKDMRDFITKRGYSQGDKFIYFYKDLEY